MPLPTPRSDEEQSSFMERCMGSETMVSEYPDAGQRAAVCHRQWRTKSPTPDTPQRIETIHRADEVYRRHRPKKFRDLYEALPAERRDKIEKRVKEIAAEMES